MSINLDISCRDASNIVTQILNLLPKDNGNIMVGEIPLTPPIFGKNVGLCKGENDKPLTSPLESDIGQLLPSIPQIVCKSPGQCTGTGKCTDVPGGGANCAQSIYQTKEACTEMQGKCIWKDCTINTDETACQSPCKWTDSSCVKMASKAVDGVTDFLGKDQCGPAFCGDTNKKMYTVPLGPCKNLEKAVRRLMTEIKEAIIKNKAGISNYIVPDDQKLLTNYLDLEKLCSAVDVFTAQEAAALISAELPKLLAARLKRDADSKEQRSNKDALVASIGDLLNKLNMAPMIKCLCPNMGTSNKPVVIPPSKQPPPPHYNMKIVGLLALSLLVLALLPLILIAVFVRPKKTKIVSLIVTIAIFILIFLILIFTNPECLVKPCPVSSDTWIGLSGTYEGKSTKIAGIQVSIKLDMSSDQNSWESQKAKILNLACQDNNTGACPVKNLLSKCDMNNTTVTLGPQETNGYPLVGSCIDSMYKFTGAGNKQTVLGVWVVRVDSKIFVQILVNLPLNIQKYVLVEIHKTS